MIDKDFILINEIREKAVKSVKWAVLGEVISRSIGPIVTLILVRILTPADFGIVGVGMIVIGFNQILQEYGFGRTLIQRQTEVEESANIIFWTDLSLSFFLYLIIFTIAPLLSQFFHEPKVMGVLRVLCLQIILFSLISIHQILFQRKFQFKQLFFIRSFAAIVPAFISIPVALFGYGVWALVYGALAGSMVQVLLFWKVSPWRPKFSYDFQVTKQLFGFSRWVILEALLLWLIFSGDSIVLGYFLGVRELGVYRVGMTFLIFVFGVFFVPLLTVIYSAFSRLQTNLDELRRLFFKTTQLLATISLPIGVGLAILAKPISSVLFGQKWLGIHSVIAIFAIRDAIFWLLAINLEVYRAIGRPDINPKLLIIAAIYYIPVYILAAPHGLFIFCLATLALVIFDLVLHIFLANRILNLPFTYFGNCIKHPLLASFVMAFVVYFIINLQTGLTLFGITAIGIATYIIALWLIKKELLIQFFTLTAQSIK